MKNSNILIYSMGRVGSVAIRKSLNRSGVQAYHVHYLFSRGEPGFGGPRWGEVRQWLEPDEPIKIITLVRDPIARSISSLLMQKRLKEMSGWSVEKARKILLQEQRIKYTLRWFDVELSPFLNIDLLSYLWATDFKKKGHYRFMRGNKDILVLRTDKLEHKSHILSGFVKRSVTITKENVSANRPGFAEQYARLYDGISLGTDLVDEVYSSKLARASFTLDELEDLKEKWA